MYDTNPQIVENSPRYNLLRKVGHKYHDLYYKHMICSCYVLPCSLSSLTSPIWKVGTPPSINFLISDLMSSNFDTRSTWESSHKQAMTLTSNSLTQTFKTQTSSQSHNINCTCAYVSQRTLTMFVGVVAPTNIIGVLWLRSCVLWKYCA